MDKLPLWIWLGGILPAFYLCIFLFRYFEEEDEKNYTGDLMLMSFFLGFFWPIMLVVTLIGMPAEEISARTKPRWQKQKENRIAKEKAFAELTRRNKELEEFCKNENLSIDRVVND